ncbi:hypothetical protein COCNU_scaffold007514G000010 [Cocos nucifera]|nr:hypothetical protein [Cocos nucifera]
MELQLVALVKERVNKKEEVSLKHGTSTGGFGQGEGEQEERGVGLVLMIDQDTTRW